MRNQSSMLVKVSIMDVKLDTSLSDPVQENAVQVMVIMGSGLVYTQDAKKSVALFQNIHCMEHKMGPNSHLAIRLISSATQVIHSLALRKSSALTLANG